MRRSGPGDMLCVQLNVVVGEDRESFSDQGIEDGARLDVCIKQVRSFEEVVRQTREHEPESEKREAGAYQGELWGTRRASRP